LQEVDGRWFLNSETGQLALDGYAFNSAPQNGQFAEFGVRPEHILFGDAARSLPINMRVDTEIVEPMGADTVLWTRVGEQTLTIRTDSESIVQVGEQISIGFNPARASLFSEDGSRL